VRVGKAGEEQLEEGRFNEGNCARGWDEDES
jgi:hypothetical protein